MTKRHTTGKRSHLAAGVALALGATLATGAAQAEVFGILNGRSAAPPTDDISVEAALQLGDDIRFISARGNYSLSEKITAFANLGQADFDESTLDGFQLGGGIFYHLTDQRFAPTIDVALKPSVGYGLFSAGSVDLNRLTVAGEVLFSGKEPISDTSLNWYGNVGLLAYYDDLDVDGGFDGGDDSDEDIEFILGGGIYLPVGPGTLYAGVDYIDDFQIGVGYRYGIR